MININSSYAVCLHLMISLLDLKIGLGLEDTVRFNIMK